jgi:hypothetical protein
MLEPVWTSHPVRQHPVRRVAAVADCCGGYQEHQPQPTCMYDRPSDLGRMLVPPDPPIPIPTAAGATAVGYEEPQSLPVRVPREALAQLRQRTPSGNGAAATLAAATLVPWLRSAAPAQQPDGDR